MSLPSVGVSWKLMDKQMRRTVISLFQEGSGAVDAANKTCKALEVCYEDSECGGEGDKCIGAFLGTVRFVMFRVVGHLREINDSLFQCNCNACIQFWRCDADEACGGLKGACDKKAGLCKCIEVR